ncbi:hypothetical protein P030_03440 [Anaplasma phagocytophilum str. CRT35]|nr:hypothetical protein P030_03440 [Anaplasma phagocytophilum str. CRT35]
MHNLQHQDWEVLGLEWEDRKLPVFHYVFLSVYPYPMVRRGINPQHQEWGVLLEREVNKLRIFHHMIKGLCLIRMHNPQHRGISPRYQDWEVLVLCWKKHKLALTDHELLVMTLSHQVNRREEHNLGT